MTDNISSDFLDRSYNSKKNDFDDTHDHLDREESHNIIITPSIDMVHEKGAMPFTHSCFSAIHRVKGCVLTLAVLWGICLMMMLIVGISPLALSKPYIIGTMSASIIVFFLPVILKWTIILIMPFKSLILQSSFKKTVDDPLINQQNNDTEWPVYSILVPLYKERSVFLQLKNALEALDYPADRLDILLLLEEGDHETINLIHNVLKNDNPLKMQQIHLPHLLPKTKPKALNVALSYLKGDYCVIFDAEDRPEPDQLKKAIGAFKKYSDKVMALQAKLRFTNQKDTFFLTRLFCLEYEVLFHHTLQGLMALHLPIPLSGTSTHMRVKDLKKIGGWDAYNVTEDCDLGMRIAQHKGLTRLLDSYTYEEAVPILSIWMKQRTRWMKGFFQTFFQYIKHPIQALRTGISAYQLIGLYGIVGGQVLSALFTPLCWLFFIIIIAKGQGSFPQIIISDTYNIGLWWSKFFMASGFLLPVIQTLHLTFVTRQDYHLLFYALLYPFYWCLAGFTAMRALWQLLFDPFKWEKTPHGLARNTKA